MQTAVSLHWPQQRQAIRSPLPGTCQAHSLGNTLALVRSFIVCVAHLFKALAHGLPYMVLNIAHLLSDISACRNCQCLACQLTANELPLLTVDWTKRFGSRGNSAAEAQISAVSCQPVHPACWAMLDVLTAMHLTVQAWLWAWLGPCSWRRLRMQSGASVLARGLAGPGCLPLQASSCKAASAASKLACRALTRRAAAIARWTCTVTTLCQALQRGGII